MINTRIVVPGGRSSPSVEAVAIEPGAAAELFRVPVTAGSWPAFDADAVAVDRGVADLYGWQAGETVEVLLPDGTPKRVTVATVFDAGAATLSLLVPRSLVQGHLLEPYDAGVLVRIAPGADRDAVAARIVRGGW